MHTLVKSSLFPAQIFFTESLCLSSSCFEYWLLMANALFRCLSPPPAFWEPSMQWMTLPQPKGPIIWENRCGYGCVTIGSLLLTHTLQSSCYKSRLGDNNVILVYVLEQWILQVKYTVNSEAELQCRNSSDLIDYLSQDPTRAISYCPSNFGLCGSQSRHYNFCPGNFSL